jgi:hypothetical protein
MSKKSGDDKPMQEPKMIKRWNRRGGLLALLAFFTAAGCSSGSNSSRRDTSGDPDYNYYGRSSYYRSPRRRSYRRYRY